MTNAKDVVLAAGTEMFFAKDASAVDRWVSPDYIQHNYMVPSGPEGIRSLIANLGDDFRLDMHRVLADGDTVATHATYYGFGPDPLVAFDVFRVEDGKLAEHWDALQPVANQTASGRSQTDGPTEITDFDKTEANRALVTDFVETVFRGGKAEAITDYISTTQYHQHNPSVGDGLDGLVNALESFATQGIDVVYDRLHKVVAEGNFVLTLSEGRIGKTHTAFYDLFRVHDGKIVEHWDVTPPIPEKLAHSNGAF